MKWSGTIWSEVIRDNLGFCSLVVQQDKISYYLIIIIRQFFLSPLHHKATIRNQSHHKMTEIIICNARANPCAPNSIPQKLWRIVRWVTPRRQWLAMDDTRCRPARRIKLLLLLNIFFWQLGIMNVSHRAWACLMQCSALYFTVLIVLLYLISQTSF